LKNILYVHASYVLELKSEHTYISSIISFMSQVLLQPMIQKVQGMLHVFN